MTDHLDPTTSDGDIIRRRWLPLDFDPTRPAGVSSSEDEHCAAEDAARACAAWLSSLGWPCPILADSGNGAHLLYRIDLPAVDGGLVQRCLEAIAQKMNSAAVEVDRKVFNAARIWKLYGTTARKGHSMPDRPHRIAQIIDVPERVEVVPVELLRALADTVSKPEPSRPSTNGDGFTSRLDVARWLTDRGVKFRMKDRPDSHGRTVYLLEQCPFDAGHGGHGETAIYQAPSGQLGADCKHSSCTGKGWQQFKQAIGPPEPGHWDPPLGNHRGNGEQDWRHYAEPNTTSGKPADAKPAEPPRFVNLLTCPEFLALDLKPRFLIRGVLIEGQPGVIGGRSKTLKTSLACDAVVSLGSGSPFLGHFHTERCNVAFWSGESGAATIRETAQRIAKAKGVDLAACSIHWSFDLPKLSQADHVAALAEVIDKHKLQVVFVDPLYLALLTPETAGQAANLYAMGAVLEPLTAMGQATGTTIVLLHHFRKTGQPDDAEPAGLEELAQSGVAEWARQWLLLARRSPFAGDGHHELWLRAGGSAGHAGFWALDIDEGVLDLDTFTGRKWDVSVKAVTDARDEAKRQRETQKAKQIERQEGEHIERVLAAIKMHPDGETEKALRAAARLNPDNFIRAALSLQKDGKAEPCEVKKTRGVYDGWKLKK